MRSSAASKSPSFAYVFMRIFAALTSGTIRFWRSEALIEALLLAEEFAAPEAVPCET
eukprot:CAMPEP_0172406360 /NCGR_PEP_ID=MMETSP1061-20121228/70391_1 /TAXON_ID=37318 /ORGANISM="Pseudo-nitzschia pungens, Strain cf. pungens" /LENGTH=56 /DNA_ID=CAMNT_0013141923 /DNA_START=41 /DNA_END=211 /DNA_ORIENTATION=-